MFCFVTNKDYNVFVDKCGFDGVNPAKQDTPHRKFRFIGVIPQYLLYKYDFVLNNYNINC